LKIGIIGGVGRMGGGLAFRLAKNHDILITSRNHEKAIQTAKNLEATAHEFHKSHMQGSIHGASNEEAIKQSETIIVTIPAESAISTMQELRTHFRQGQIVVSTVVSMKRSKGVFKHMPLSKSNPTDCVDEPAEQKSAAELIQETVRPASVVSSFHTVPAAYLTDINKVLDIDVFIASDDSQAISVASKLICEIPNLRPLRAGSLENSRLIESMVPLLLNVATLNDLKEPSIRVVPWISTAYDGCS